MLITWLDENEKIGIPIARKVYHLPLVDKTLKIRLLYRVCFDYGKEIVGHFLYPYETFYDCIAQCRKIQILTINYNYGLLKMS